MSDRYPTRTSFGISLGATIATLWSLYIVAAETALFTLHTGVLALSFAAALVWLAYEVGIEVGYEAGSRNASGGAEDAE